MHTRNSPAIRAAAAALVLAPLSLAQGQYQCTVVDAFASGYDLRETYLTDISEQNLAVGTTVKAFQVPGGTSITYTGFYWSPTTEKVAIDLLTPLSVNNAGRIGGWLAVFDIPSTQLTWMPIPPGYFGPIEITGVNDAGVGVGYVQTCSCSNSQHTLQVPYVWDAAGGGRVVIDLPAFKGFSRVNNHNVAIGYANGGSFGKDAFVYDLNTGQYTLLGALDPPPGASGAWTTATEITDGGLVIGQRMLELGGPRMGYLWSVSSGFTYIPAPNGWGPNVYPTGVNDAGTVVGWLDDPTGAPRAFVWDAQHGVRDLNTLTTAPTGFILRRSLRMNENGWIVGDGQGGGGFSKAFVLKPMDACYADCNADGMLTVADFGCFQTRFVAGDPYADCNTDGQFTVADFGCFQTAFVAGCP